MHKQTRYSHQRSVLAAFLTGSAIVLVPALGAAHHSFAVHYDPEKTQVVEGIAKSFRFTNPHGILLLEVTNDAGEVDTWTVETTSPSAMRRRGWSQDMIQPGDTVRVDGYIARDGSHLMRIRTVTAPDGTPLAQPIESGDD
jgi:hypothetical protein